MRQRIEAMSDTDLQASVLDLDGIGRYLAGDFAGAAPFMLRAAEISPLNLPYILPSVGRAAVLAGDRTTAQAVIDRMRRHGIRGRAIVADVDVIVAGVRALDGDRDGAMAGYRHAMAMYRDLGLAWDEAKLAFEAVHVLGVGDAELAAWTDRARTVFTRLRAKPMLDLLDRATQPPATPGRAGPAPEPAPDLAATPDGAAGWSRGESRYPRAGDLRGPRGDPRRSPPPPPRLRLRSARTATSCSCWAGRGSARSATRSATPRSRSWCSR